MSTYSMFRYWSITYGMHVARIAMKNEHGDELFTIVPQDGSGAHNRSQRTKALEALEAALATGQEPGRVWLEGEAVDG